MQQIDASELRRNMSRVLKHDLLEGPVDIMMHGQVIARIVVPPESKASSAKPEIDQRKISALCKKHRIVRLALFGSILRDDFNADSDVDLLIESKVGHLNTLRSHQAAVDDFEAMFRRRVDLVRYAQVEDSSIRSREIRQTAQVIYGA